MTTTQITEAPEFAALVTLVEAGGLGQLRIAKTIASRAGASPLEVLALAGAEIGPRR